MIKAADKWLPGYVTWEYSHPRVAPTDLMIAVCDHFEPFHATDKAGALKRMDVWLDQLPAVQKGQADHDGQLPKHTFFYPIEQYDADVVGALEALATQTGNEVEVHLHHEGESRAELEALLAQGISDFSRHGFLTSDSSGQKRFAFIHGNWALDDANLDGSGCGVRDELSLLRRAGCYADLTMPSAPNSAQSRVVNQIYYSKSTTKGRSHDCGIALSGLTTGLRSSLEYLLMVQGPLGPDFSKRKWGLLPRIENGDLTDHNPPSVRRANLWLRLAPVVLNRPEWKFVKLHTHGALERNQSILLTASAREFHEGLRSLAKTKGIRLHYVSARELTNIVHAAEDGKGGDAAQWRDYLYPPPQN